MKKRIIGFILCLVLIVGALPTVTVFAKNIASGTGWHIDSAGCLHLTGNVTNLSEFSGNTPWEQYKSNIKKVVSEKGSSVTSCAYLFDNCQNLTSVDLSKLNTSGVTSMRYMFGLDLKLEFADLNGIDTSSVTEMDYMFCRCEKLTSLDLSGFDTAKVTYMYNMFDSCTSLKSLDLKSFNTANVTYMSDMFYNCTSLESLDLKNFNTAKVTDMSAMFKWCESLKTLDLSGFDTANVTDMSGMFGRCYALKKLDISGFNIANTTDTTEMFDYCKNLINIAVNKSVLEKTSDQIVKLSQKWSNAADGTLYTGKSELKNITGNVTLIKGELTLYNIYIGNVRVNSGNKDDILGDGGSAKYYEKGSCTEGGTSYGQYGAVLVLDNFEITEDEYHSDGKNKAQIYINEDTYIVLKGENNLYKKGHADGIYISSGKYIWFYGDGTLNIDTRAYDYDAIKGDDPAIFVHENVKLNLTGAHAVNYATSTGEDFAVFDNAKVSCYATRTDDGHDYAALTAPYVCMYDNAELICESQYFGSAFDTWGDEFSNDDYDIKILKQGEYSGDGCAPYAPTLGINVAGGIHEDDCRYVSIKVKHSIIPGDVNGDKAVNSDDAIYLLYHVFFPSDYSINQPADFNKSGKTDSEDAIYLLYHVFFPKDYLLQ